MPGQRHRRDAGGRRPPARPGAVLYPPPRRAGPARRGRSAGTGRQGAVPPRRLRAVPHPTFVTAPDAAEPALANQQIRPYSDLLLHDMGDGLADNRAEFEASGREWRTPPLWGLGLTQRVSGHTQLLHDGRARNLLEAILWHAGEAQAARDRVLTFDASQRAALLAFLNSL
ncbi:di-heme oxidoredictase family protein [Azotobacter chroococcum]